MISEIQSCLRFILIKNVFPLQKETFNMHNEGIANEFSHPLLHAHYPRCKRLLQSKSFRKQTKEI